MILFLKLILKLKNYFLILEFKETVANLYTDLKWNLERGNFYLNLKIIYHYKSLNLSFRLF